MAYQVDFSEYALRQLKKLNKDISERIISFLENRVATSDDPKALATRLKGDLQDLWRFRVGDYRIICEINDFLLKVLVIRIGHRKDIYR